MAATRFDVRPFLRNALLYGDQLLGTRDQDELVYNELDAEAYGTAVLCEIHIILL